MSREVMTHHFSKIAKHYPFNVSFICTYYPFYRQVYFISNGLKLT